MPTGGGSAVAVTDRITGWSRAEPAMATCCHRSTGRSKGTAQQPIPNQTPCTTTIHCSAVGASSQYPERRLDLVTFSGIELTGGRRRRRAGRRSGWSEGVTGFVGTPWPPVTSRLAHIRETSNGMTMFDDLRASHEVQRSLARSMTHARSSAENRRAAFLALAHELDAHATAEERHLYVPLLMDDAGLSVSRHALADHHKAEELVEQLRGVEPATDQFGELAKQLVVRGS